MSDASGTVVWKWDQTEPFGDSVPNGDPGNTGNVFDMPLRFPGQYFDRETGSHYNYFRDYDAAIGRYKQSDPIGLDGGLNTYRYAGMNPLILVDQDGLKVTVYSRLVNDPRARLIQARHAWLGLDPDNVEQVQCMLRQAGLTMFSFPLLIGGYAGPNGSLIAAANAPSDSLAIPDPNRKSRVLQPPRNPMRCTICGSPTADSQFIFDLIANASSYQNNLRYDPLPSNSDAIPQGYNSNSFAQGLLNTTGYSGGLGVGNTIGSGIPVPASAFQ